MNRRLASIRFRAASFGTRSRVLQVDGMTMVVATPYLDEAERCHRVALMYDGVIRQTGTPAEIREKLGLQRLEVRAADLGQLGQAEDILTAHSLDQRRAALWRSTRSDGGERRSR